MEPYFGVQLALEVMVPKNINHFLSAAAWALFAMEGEAEAAA
jgi:hypothetical protein